MELLSGTDAYFVDCVHLAIILQSLGLLKTRFNFTKLLYDQESKVILEKELGSNLTKEYGSKCIDLQSIYSFYLSQMKVQEQEMQYTHQQRKVNTLTDAVCIMMAMEDNEVSIAALATFVLHNQKAVIDAILETDS
jgi:hypothetical protein